MKANFYSKFIFYLCTIVLGSLILISSENYGAPTPSDPKKAVVGAKKADAAKAAADAKKAEAAKAAEAAQLEALRKAAEAKKAADLKKARELKKAEDKKTKKEKKSPKTSKDMAFLQDEGAGSKSFSKRYMPRAGLLFEPQFPLTELGDVMGLGLASFQLFGDIAIRLAFLQRKRLELRTGASFGFSGFSNKPEMRDATLSMIPVLAYSQLGYIIKNSKIGIIKPYFHLGMGFSMTSQSSTDSSGKNVEDSSMDGLVSAGLGTGLELKQVKKVEFLLDFRYLMAFETSSQGFFVIALGVGYKF
jgi:hypothetical protein